MEIFISAAEPSGDIIAAEVMDCLPSNVQYLGIGGTEMQKHGLHSLFPMEELSVMGFMEVLPRYFNIMKRIAQTVDTIIARQPDIVLTVDAYSFHSRLAKGLRKKRFKGRLVHYVSPAIWAWHQKRAQHLSLLYDEVYCIFPFEPPYFANYNIKAEFVGHPAAFRLQKKDPTFRKRYNLSTAPIIAVLPGSRMQEINKLHEVFLKACQLINKSYPDIQFVTPTLPHLVDKIQDISKQYNLNLTLVTGTKDRFYCFQEAQAALAASGTVALELALNKVPSVIGYKTSPLTYFLAKNMAQVNYITVLNIIANKEVIPEFVQGECTPENLAGSLIPYLEGKDRTHLIAEIASYTEQLKSPSNLKPQEIVAQRLLGQPM